MLAGIDWQSVHLAGAFVLGAILATVATLRVTRAVADMFREQRRRDREGRADR